MTDFLLIALIFIGLVALFWYMIAKIGGGLGEHLKRTEGAIDQVIEDLKATQQNLPSESLVECWICPDCHQLNRLNNQLGSFECQNCLRQRKGDEALTTVKGYDYWLQARYGVEAERRRRAKEAEEQARQKEAEEQRKIDEQIRRLLGDGDVEN